MFPAVACGFCGLFDPAKHWYLADDLGGVFPCGHQVDGLLTRGLAALSGALFCPACQGTGTRQEWRTAADWGRQDAKDAREKKQSRSSTAKLLADTGRGLGFSARQVRRMLAVLAPTCEAHCRRTGNPCPKRVVLGSVRCRLHGGLSTGPKTAAGRARISESNRRRYEKETGEKKPYAE